LFSGIQELFVVPLASLVIDNSKARSGAGQLRNCQEELNASSFNTKHLLLWYICTKLYTKVCCPIATYKKNSSFPTWKS